MLAPALSILVHTDYTIPNNTQPSITMYSSQSYTHEHSSFTCNIIVALYTKERIAHRMLPLYVATLDGNECALLVLTVCWSIGE